MTMARSQLVNVDVTPWYHVISKTVRGAILLAQGDTDRKQWIEQRLQFLSEVFGIAVAGFSILDNHFHALVRLEPERVQNWSDEEVVRRWAQLFPPRGKDRKPLKLTAAWIAQKQADPKYVARTRQRLGSLSWFMKCLKEPLAQDRQPQRLADRGLLAIAVQVDCDPGHRSVVGDLRVHRPQPAGRRAGSASRRLAAHFGQDACRSLPQQRTAGRPASRPRRLAAGPASQPLDGVRLVALSDRRPPSPGCRPRRSAGRPVAGQLPAAGRLHQPPGPSGQGPRQFGGGLDPGPAGDRLVAMVAKPASTLLADQDRGGRLLLPPRSPDSRRRPPRPDPTGQPQRLRRLTQEPFHANSSPLS